MKKILIKTIIILFSLAIAFNICPNYTFASSISLENIHKTAKNFIKVGENENPVDEKDLQETIVPIAQILVLAGSIIIAICTAIMAIKYLTASPDQKAKLKVQLVGLVVATIVIFGAQFIWSVMFDFLNEI